MSNNEKFFLCIKKWLTVFLPRQRCLSENSIKAYKITLNLLIEFLRTEKGMSVKNIEFDIFDQALVSEFIEWLASVRKCSISTQNSRLMALKSFFHYAAISDLSLTSLELEILKIPVKKGNKQRCVPLLTKTIKHYEQYLRVFHTEPPSSEDYVFYAVRHGIKHQMS